MKARTLFFLAAFFAAFCACAGHKIVMTVDTFDEIGLYKDYLPAKHIDTLMRTARTSGVDRVLWRVAGLGVAGYHSKLLSNCKWLATADNSVMAARMKDGKVPQSSRYNGASPLANTLARMDPLEVAKKAARREKVEFYAWIDLIDEQNGRFLRENPDCLIKSKTGTLWPGVRDYSNPKAVEEKLKEIDEVLAYEPDGLYLSWSCHSSHLDFPEEDGAFGMLKGRYMTEFLRKLRKRTAPKGVKILMGLPLGGTVNLNSPYMSASNKYKIELDWKKWIDEGLVDGFSLGDYEWTWDGVPNWTLKGLKREECVPGAEPADRFGPEYVAYNRGRVELLYFSSWLSAYAQHHKGASAPDLPQAMKMRTQTIKDTGADGIILHEAHTFEYYKGFNTIQEMRRSLDHHARSVSIRVSPLNGSKVSTGRMEMEFFVKSNTDCGEATAVATLLNVDNGQKFERRFKISLNKGEQRHWAAWGGEAPYCSGRTDGPARAEGDAAEPFVPDGFYIAQAQLIGADGRVIAEKKYSNDELYVMRVEKRFGRKISADVVKTAVAEIESWYKELSELREKAVAAGADTSRPDLLLVALKETLRQQKGRINAKEYKVILENRDYCRRKCPKVKAELERLIAEPKSAVPTAFVPMPKKRLGIKNGYFTTPDDGKPVFLLGQCIFAIWPHLDTMHALHYNLVHIEEDVDVLFPDSKSEAPTGELVIADGRPPYKMVDFLDKCLELGIKVDLGLTARPPKWFFDKHPDAKLKGHSVAGFVPFDIESAETREWVEKYYAAIMPKIAGHPALNCIWLANEPTYWNMGARAEAKFREAMRSKYGSIEKLNEAWGEKYASFDEVRVPADPKKTSPAHAEYWKFNIGRLTEFFAFLKSCVRKYDKTVYTCYKLNNLHMGWFRPLPNCDQEGVSDLGELVGMDSGTYPFAKPFYDWLRCLSPEKPMVNLEFKGGGSRSKLDIWKSAMFGLAGNDVWCWHANPRFSGTMAYTEALCEITEAMEGIQRNIEVVADFQKMPRSPFAVMYPDPVINLDKSYFDVHTPVVNALRDLGYTPDYMTEKRLLAGELDKRGYGMLILPNADYMRDETVEAIGKWIERGGKAVVIGDYPLHDPIGRVRTVPWKAHALLPKCDYEDEYGRQLAELFGKELPAQPLFVPSARERNVQFRTIARKNSEGRETFVSYLLNESSLNDIVLKDIKLCAPAVEAKDLITGEKIDLSDVFLRRWDFRLIEWRVK